MYRIAILSASCYIVFGILSYKTNIIDSYSSLLYYFYDVANVC